MIESVFRKISKLQSGYRIVLETLFRGLPHKGVEVMKEKWDVLIILDACRFDYFKKYNEIKGKLEKKISLGTDTREWIIKNFTENYPDVVYVSGNPHISKFKLHETIGSVPFFHIDEVWDWGWNEKIKTVPPAKVSKASLKNIKKFPDKRVMIHYMQPHQPFIAGPKLILSRLESFRSEAKGMSDASDQHTWEMWEKLVMRGELSIKKVKEAYINNLKFVLSDIKKLIKKLNGRIVITSDHGECFGEFWLYGHPNGIYIKPLVEVPWLIIGG